MLHIDYTMWHTLQCFRNSQFYATWNNQLFHLCHLLQIDILVWKVVSFVCMQYIAWHAVLWNARFDQWRQKIVQRQKFCDLRTYQNGFSNTRLYCTLAITCVIRYDVWAIHDSMLLKESTFSQLSNLCHSLQIDILVCNESHLYVCHT